MERPLQVLQPPAGTHCESGPDATPVCREMLSSLLPLIQAGFTPEQGLSEGLNDVQRLTGTTPESSNPESPSDEWGYDTAYQSCSPGGVSYSIHPLELCQIPAGVAILPDGL